MSAAFGQSFSQPEDTNDESSSITDGESGDGPREAKDGDQKRDEGEFDELEALTTAQDTQDTVGNQEHADMQGRQHTSIKNLNQEDTRAESFITARTRPPKRSTGKLYPSTPGKKGSSPSFITAREKLDLGSGRQDEPNHSLSADRTSATNLNLTVPGIPHRSDSSSSTGSRLDNINAGSTTHLVPGSTGKPSTTSSPKIQTEHADGQLDVDLPAAVPTSGGLVRFNLEEVPKKHAEESLLRGVSTTGSDRQRILKRMRRGSARPGEIVKMEKMLVRVDITSHELPPDFDENDSLKIEARVVEKWREYIVVCRESVDDESSFSMQMYKSRVIPTKELLSAGRASAHDFSLKPKNTHVNLFSSLDKTLVIWLPWKKSQTVMYILRPRSSASSVEWYTFIRNALGWQRSRDLQVSVPDLSITLLLENPFSELERSRNAVQRITSDDTAVSKTMDAERAIASTIIQQCLGMLENNPEWSDVLERWLTKGKIGLAWKRYDRLEWIYGTNEQRMYGTMAMARTHELELRPKVHYATEVKTQKGHLTEPAPVEGFLVRLTSQKGKVKRLGKLYYKRLYFAVHNQYLCYTRPAKALPPPPPKLACNNDGTIPSTKDILHQVPLIFAVNPYPDNDANGEVDWLQSGTRESKLRHDEDAYKEGERKINTMLNAEGFINLSHVVRVQNAQRGNSPADENTDTGPDVDFHEDVEDTPRDDGQTDQFDDERTFELVLKNKLVIRLQAFNEKTKNEWIHRLRNLILYWKLRLADDMTLLKTVRGQNLKILDIDEEMEAYLGQAAKKWEVTRSTASPKLFNMCGISCCRAITVSVGSLVL